MTTQAELINSKRQVELDLVKFLAIIFMAIVHCIEMFGSDIYSGVGYFFNNITGGLLSAPIFMFCMGIGFAYSKRTSAKYLMKRGVKILALGYSLNIVRRLVPLLYFSSINNMEPVQYYLNSFIEVDILQFAGLAMILTGALQHTKKAPLYAAGIGVLASLVHTFLPTLEPSNLFVSSFAGLFVYTEYPDIELCFPLFAWYIFVGVGYLFGTKLIKMENPSNFYIKVGIPCFVVSIIYLTITFIKEHGFMAVGDANFYMMNIEDAVANILLAFGYIGIMRALVKLFSQKTNSFISRTSSCLTLIYVFHWIIMRWFVDTVLVQIAQLNPNIWIVALIGILVLFVAVPISFTYSKNKKKNLGV